MITSILLTVFLSVPLGILSAVRQNRITDYLIRFFSFIGNSLPNFFVSLLLIWFFSLKLKLLPVMGNNAGWKSVILPTLTLALSMASVHQTGAGDGAGRAEQGLCTGRQGKRDQ